MYLVFVQKLQLVRWLRPDSLAMGNLMKVWKMVVKGLCDLKMDKIVKKSMLVNVESLVLKGKLVESKYELETLQLLKNFV